MLSERGQDLNLRPSGYEPDALDRLRYPATLVARRRVERRFPGSKPSVITDIRASKVITLILSFLWFCLTPHIFLRL